MKKIILMASVVALLSACNANTDENTVVSNDTLGPVITNETPLTTTETVVVNKYSPSEGDVTYRNNQLLVWRGNDWVKVEKDVTLDNGVVIYKNGEVKRDGKTVKLEDGEVVTSVGKFFDKTGDAIDDAWNSTKKGVRKAGDAIDKAAKDIKKSVDGDKNK
ncbi:MAG: DUF6799 domain-containing protein [Ginsengibacter sp.]|jgi:hypothetical protein